MVCPAGVKHESGYVLFLIVLECTKLLVCAILAVMGVEDVVPGSWDGQRRITPCLVVFMLHGWCSDLKLDY